MSFIEKIKNYRSISTIGLEKNVGKTETLNFILERLNREKYKIAVTSIGIDGEVLDQVTSTSKPEIYISEGTIFVTSEKHYRQKKFQAEILSISDKTTPLGRLITARALRGGFILLSGPSNTSWVKAVIEETLNLDRDIVIVDGALSRLSVGSPVITDGIVLSTGAAVSLNINEVIKKTRHTINLLKISGVDEKTKNILENLKDGIYILEGSRERKLPIKSILHFLNLEENIFKENMILYISGAITDKFIEYICRQEHVKSLQIIVRDFTKIFISPEILNRFLKKGGTIKVLYSTSLIGVTVNPVSPTGYSLDSNQLIDAIKEFVDVPVINVREVKNESL